MGTFISSLAICNCPFMHCLFIAFTGEERVETHADHKVLVGKAPDMEGEERRRKRQTLPDGREQV